MTLDGGRGALPWTGGGKHGLARVATPCGALTMPRGEQVLRHWNVLRTLQARGRGVPLRDLAEEFEVSERTIQRDLELLEELGFPIQHDDDVHGKRFWRLPADLPPTGVARRCAGHVQMSDGQSPPGNLISWARAGPSGSLPKSTRKFSLIFIPPRSVSQSICSRQVPFSEMGG